MRDHRDQSARPLATATARRLALAVAALLALGACAYRGADNPFVDRFTWFDYIGGGDIERRCAAGAPERYRLVYNANFREQVRAYDIQPAAEPGAFALRARVIGPSDLSQITLRGADSLFDPWRARVEMVILRDAEMTVLRRAMESGGVFRPPPEGLRLPSEDFFWTVAACRDGGFHFNAFLWPSERFDQATFPNLLFAWDPTGVKVRPPERAQYRYRDEDSDRSSLNWSVTVGKNGLAGVRPLF